MKINELLNELNKRKSAPKAGDDTPHDYNPGWEQLNRLKQQAQKTGERMTGAYQLFVPRGHPGAKSLRDRRLANLANRWAWDEEDPTKLKPQYDRWERGVPQDQVDEAAPIIPAGQVISPPGNNKPHALLWTSTAIKSGDAWTSRWANWVAQNQPTWLAPKGYLYQVKPGALILSLDSDHDAEQIFQAFGDLGRVNAPPASDYYRDRPSAAMRVTFPWDQIIRHFDGVRHGGYNGYGYGDEFMYGWDVESTAWFNGNFLQLKAEVPVVGYQEDY
jgi:hypothetical protein